MVRGYGHARSHPRPGVASWARAAALVFLGAAWLPTDSQAAPDWPTAFDGGLGDRAGVLRPDMIRIPAGTFLRGHDDAHRNDEGPAHRVTLASFELDATLVTRAAFASFVQTTGYVTTAERTGYGISSREGMEDWAWERVPGASWRRPFHPDWPEVSDFLRNDAPVVMVSWFDAAAYCAHRGRRLPTEAEWEYAMRGGRAGTRFPWGDVPEKDGRYLLNFWQGTSHEKNTRRDGWLYVSPVRAFPANTWGIYDAVGNVWQWTADVYAADTYARLARELSKSGRESVFDPRGPASATAERRSERRVLRGGSWWCGVCTCEGYGLHYRGKADPEAAFSNNGFRCAKSL